MEIKEGKKCDDFLRWALQKMDMCWEGFRKVRNQVCKRIRRRLRELKINDYEDYRSWLEVNPQVWKVVDQMTHITITG